MLERFIGVIDPLNEVLLEMKWNPLSHSVIQIGDAIASLMKPCYHFIINQQKQDITISKVYVSILEMLDSIEEYKPDLNLINEVKKSLLEELNKRLKKVLDPQSESFNSIYIQASIFDINEAFMVDGNKYDVDRYLKEAARRGILELQASDSTVQTTNNSSDGNSINQSVPIVTADTFRSKLLAKRRSEVLSNMGTQNIEEQIEDVVKKYKKEIQNEGNMKMSTLDFWRNATGSLIPTSECRIRILNPNPEFESESKIRIQNPKVSQKKLPK
uniref:Uncharacterized protein n=1 Tax=Acrobeloides nanus TaxID=290746 RepID=A0A914EIY6_9BILA